MGAKYLIKWAIFIATILGYILSICLLSEGYSGAFIFMIILTTIFFITSIRMWDKFK